MDLLAFIKEMFASGLSTIAQAGIKSVTGSGKDISSAARDVTGIRRDIIETKLAGKKLEDLESMIQKATLEEVERFCPRTLKVMISARMAEHEQQYRSKIESESSQNSGQVKYNRRKSYWSERWRPISYLEQLKGYSDMVSQDIVQIICEESAHVLTVVLAIGTQVWLTKQRVEQGDRTLGLPFHLKGLDNMQPKTGPSAVYQQPFANRGGLELRTINAILKNLRLGDVASRRDPRRAPWGYYGSDDYVFGVGLFRWFNTKEGLLQFLAEHEGADSVSHGQAILRAAMRKTANQMIAGRLGFDKGRQRFNAVLKGHLDIQWMGHFDEMLSGKTSFCKKLRALFLQVGDHGTVPAIEPGEVKDFIEELRSYGH